MQPHHSNLIGLLPPELLNNIASFLPTRDFNALRSTCKLIEDKLFPYWSNCYFRKRQFMIDSFSLQTLVDISQHKSLSNGITHLVIGLDDLGTVMDMQLHEVGERSRWQSAKSAQETLLRDGAAIGLLSAALENLPNLKAIEIRDFNSPTRYRDTTRQQMPAEWRSYGSSSYAQWPRTTTFLCGRGPQTEDFIVQVFTTVLAALNRCSPQLESLEVILRDRLHGLKDCAFAIHSSLSTVPVRALQGLKKLHLDLASNGVPFPVPHSGEVCDPGTKYLRSFLALTPNITWLRLNFNGKIRPATANFFSWLGLEPGCRPPSTEMDPDEVNNPTPVALPLRRLDLSNISISTNVLRLVLEKFPDLEALSLRRATLELENGQLSVPTLDRDGTDEDGDCIWANFIRGLPVSNPNLTYLMLSNLKQLHWHKVQPIVFYDEAECTSTDRKTVANVDRAKLEELADKTWTRARYCRSLSREKDEKGEQGVDIDVDENEDEGEDEHEDENEDEVGPGDGVEDVDEDEHEDGHEDEHEQDD